MEEKRGFSFSPLCFTGVEGENEVGSCLLLSFFLQLEYQSLSRCTDDHKIMINWRKSGAYSILFFPLSKADMGILGIKL